MAVHVPVVAVYSASSKGGFYGMRITSLRFVVVATRFCRLGMQTDDKGVVSGT